MLQSISPHLAKIIVCALLAAVPAVIWAYIFLKKRKEPLTTVFITFVAGMISVTPILLYKMSWRYFPELNLFDYFEQFQGDLFGFTNLVILPIGVLLSFLLVGMIEEYMKHVAVEATDQGKIRNIDDAIELSIVAALGFAFVENIMYFFYIWQYQGIDTLYLSFIFRSIFSTFAHILFSGIYGYYYGIAFFAEPIYQEEIKQKRGVIRRFFVKILTFNSSSLFAQEKVTQGLFYAVVLHALFNVMLEMNLTFFMVPFLVIGYAVLTYLFSLKKTHKEYKRVRTKWFWD